MEKQKEIRYLFGTIGIFFLVFLIAFLSNSNFRGFTRVLFSNEMEVDSTGISRLNSCILKKASAMGPDIAPTYKTAVCTEYLINVLSHCIPINNETKKGIRIITDGPLDSLLLADAPVMKGVQTALLHSGQGIKINPKDARAGDLVQVWYRIAGFAFGHSGILRAMNMDKGIFSMYSSSPITGGHGIQNYPITEYMYVVRLK